MTRLSKPVSRIVPEVPRRGDLVVTLTATGIEFRYPRKRFRVLLPYGIAMQQAEWMAGNALRAERKAKRERRIVQRRLLRAV